MALLLVLIGILPPALCGWVLVRCLEGRSAVLTRLERATLGVIFGITATMFTMFLVQITLGVPLSITGFLIAFGAVLLPALLIRFVQRRQAAVTDPPLLAPNPALPLWGKIVVAIFAVWTVVKIAAAAFALFTTPTYYDDTIDNWNYRAKVYYHAQQIELVLPPDAAPTGISSYPPMVPLMKVWITTLAGEWNESASNGLHAVWYVCCLVLLYCAIRRKASHVWALGGVYLLSSLPLFLMQGMNAYADVYVASHIFASVFFLFLARDSAVRSAVWAFLRLAAVAIALLTVAKNEGLALYAPLLLLTALMCVWVKGKEQVLTGRDVLTAALWAIGALVLITGPWVLYKQMNGLVFGNAHSVSAITFSWHKDVPQAILINLFLEGNWLLLFPFFVLLLMARWRDAFSPPLIIPTMFFFLAFGAQTVLYLFTSLASEALMQTGYARGIAHLVPVVTWVTVMMVRGQTMACCRVR